MASDILSYNVVQDHEGIPIAQYDCTNTRGMKYRTGTSTYCLLPTLPCPTLPYPALPCPGLANLP